ncbi:WD repeat-containing protein 74-like [Ptychodera flava]|uniref:WD repeat-containing protein 74-like n=1 Tax=Ptychodera flava TaxID=63121 RepID=UPI00396A60FE
MAAFMNSVWVGAETGILKGIDLEKKLASNYSNLSTLSKEQEITAMCWGDDKENQICLGLRNGVVKTFDLEAGEYTKEDDCSGGQGSFKGIAKIDDHLITCTESGLLTVWKDDPEQNIEINVGENICKMRQNPDKKNLLATGGKENDLKIWDLENYSEPIFKAKNVRNDFLDLRVPVWVCDMQFLPESSKIVTCTGHHHVRLYDPSTPQRRPVLSVEFDEYPLMALSLVPGANSVIVGNSQGRMGKIDLRKGLVQKAFKGFAGSIRSIQCHQTKPLVASCGLDRHLRIHNVHSGELKHKVYLKSRLNCLLFSSQDPPTPEKTESDQPGGKRASDTREGSAQSDSDDDVWNKMDTVTERDTPAKQPRRVSTRKKVKTKH